MIRTLIALAVAGAFAAPMAAQASVAGDNILIAQAGSGGADGPDLNKNKPGGMSSGSSRDGASAGASQRGNFDRWDRNKDGFISRDEAKDAEELNTRFSELDKNNDGKLSREEYDALHAEKRGATGTTGSGSMSGSMGSAPRPGAAGPQPGKGGGDASTSGANTK